MKIKILGTAAYERVPAMFCECPICEYARQHGGKDVRTQAQTLINEDLLVDFGQDNFPHSLQPGVNFRKVQHVLITHNHADHYMPQDFAMTNRPYGHNQIEPAIQVYGGNECAEKYNATPDRPGKTAFVKVEAFQTFQAGNYTVTALPARHGTENPFVYIIHDGSKTLFYDNDSGIELDETYEFLGKSDFHFDAVICDCTNGVLHYDRVHSHKSLIDNKNHREKLKELGVVDENTTWIVTHFSHNGLVSADRQPLHHEVFSKMAEEQGMLCAYDGIEIEI